MQGCKDLVSCAASDPHLLFSIFGLGTPQQVNLATGATRQRSSAMSLLRSANTVEDVETTHSFGAGGRLPSRNIVQSATALVSQRPATDFSSTFKRTTQTIREL
ncbi:hypothetical protein NLJ89_g9892 [Agrocybe chaxingu]|uniref:Uncharacterized protein n=1 Tax=Agrocybe chaxingu TaxID=84603 RepID=A0A9W8MSM8_9AGAR|nr:hypothetical protein NLJ89_g9892 [Agrocybe chaxingu]